MSPDQLVGLLMLIADLRLQINAQAAEIALLQAALTEAGAEPPGSPPEHN